MIAVLAAVVWLTVAALLALTIGAVIARAEKPAPEFDVPEPSDFDQAPA